MDTYRAGAIGRTGQGNYGHQLHLAYQAAPNARLVAVSDPDPDGLRRAGQETGTERLYSDYREMLEKEDLDLVSVCPRWPDCHEEMVIACAEAGVKGILCEKPFARTLAEADRMIKACDRLGAKIAVAHGTAGAYAQHAKEMIDRGDIGELQVMRARGKEDHRSGAEDFFVLGTHQLDTMRYFAGDVDWATGHVTQDGRDVSVDDIREGNEALGLMAGNGVSAYYAFRNGVSAHFESKPGHSAGSAANDRYRTEIYGTEGIIALGSSEMYRHPSSLWPAGEDGKWERVVLEEWDNNPKGPAILNVETIAAELIDAVEQERDVVRSSSDRDGRAALEMIMAVHESQRLGRRVAFPMANRENPYETWLREAEKPRP